jgi:Helix-turn-helix domain
MTANQDYRGQNELVLSHLKQHRVIDPHTALKRYGIMRLGARIYELRKQGVLIGTQSVTVKNRMGVRVRYARYVLHRDDYPT